MLGEVVGPAPIRVEAVTQDVVADVFGAPEDASRISPQAALAELAEEGPAVLLYLPPTQVDSLSAPYLEPTRRSHLVTQILRDLGVTTIIRPDADGERADGEAAEGREGAERVAARAGKANSGPGRR